MGDKTTKKKEINSINVKKHEPVATNNTITTQKEMTYTVTTSGILLSTTSEFDKEELYRSSRGLMKTSAKQIGRDTKKKEQLGLMDIGNKTIKGYCYSVKVADFFDYLAMEWQRQPLNSEGFLVIKNLSLVAKELDTQPKYIKRYLTLAGAHTYPFIRKRGNSIEETFIIFFTIRVYRTNTNGEEIEEGPINAEDHDKLNERRPFKEIWVKPHSIIRGEQGRDSRGKEIKDKKYKRQEEGLGNVLRPVASFFAGIHLTSMGKKLLNYTGSNKPTNSIGFEKLLKHLGFTEQDLRQRGAPRIRKEIEAGFKELIRAGHIKSYSPPSEERDIYKWVCSNKYYRYSELIEGKTDKPVKKKFVDFNDKTVPVEKRKKAYTDWALEKGTPPVKVKKIADRKFK